MTAKILFLPGDGIGPEIAREAQEILDWFGTHRGFDFELTHDLVGGACYDERGVAISPETIEIAKASDAIIFGAVGGEKWAGIDYHHRPEAALLALRKELDLFANIRPALCFQALEDASSLKPEKIRGLDIVIIRELTGGVYFGEPRGIEVMASGKRRGVNTHSYDSDEIKRIALIAFDLARKRSQKLVSVEKRNVMEAGQLWYEEVCALGKTMPDIELSHMLADNCAMQLVREPKQFDVILTDNLFGDLLSDIAAQLTGSLGMLPSASLGAQKADGRFLALYEPVHGSAPDIAGQNKANPLAMILSVAMALRYSFRRDEDADLLEGAVRDILDDGQRSFDIARGDEPVLSTRAMGKAVLLALDKRT